MTFFLGCAIWAYKGWIGELYPHGTRATDFLSLYGQRFTAVEGNTTFYVTPDRQTVTRWREQTPLGFHFCPKLPRDLTHQGKLEPYIPKALDFLELMQGLGDRLGPIFVQLPPGYSPELFQDLTHFLTVWPRSLAPLCLEVRHRDWFTPAQRTRLQHLLEDLGVGRVLLDSRPIYEGPKHPQLSGEFKKPNVPLQPDVTAPFTLIRYISHPEQAANEPYLKAWVTQVGEWLKQGIQVYFFVHCPVEARSPTNARYFQQLLEQQQVAVPPLPWNHLTPENQQLSLF